MERVLRLVSVLTCAALLLAFTAPQWAHAGEAEDEEAIAEKERLKKDKKAAEEKARRAGKDPAAPATTDDKKKGDPFAEFQVKNGDTPVTPPGKADPKKPDTAGAKQPAKPGTPGKPAAPAAPAAFVPPDDPLPNLCPLCRGTEKIPNLPYKPYIKFEAGKAPAPEYPAQWKYCEKCKAGIDAKTAEQEISDDLKKRQDAARDKEKTYEEWNDNKKFAQFETPFVVVRSMLTDKENKAVANALEKCASILINNAKSLVLAATRPNHDNLLFFADVKTITPFIDKALDKQDNSFRDMCKQSGGYHFSDNNTNRDSAHAMGKPNMPPAENIAVFSWGRMLMEAASHHKAKAWLVEGFAAYCENVTLGANTMHTFAYEMSTLKLDHKDWNGMVKKSMAKMRPWAEMFNQSLEMLKMEQYLQFYSVVSFLIRTDPVKFDRLVLVIKDGKEAGPALEAVYGKKVTDLQADWAKWAMTQK